MFIKDDIVTYKGKSIIGENVYIIKNHIKNINSNLGIKTNYNECIDSNNNKNIIVTKGDYYGINYPTLFFIVDDKDIITEVKYFSN